MKNNIVYILACRIQGNEYIGLYNENGRFTAVSSPNLELAKKNFSPAYKTLLDGPLKNPILYQEMIQKMATFQPVFLKIQMDNLSQTIQNARADDKLTTINKISLLAEPVSYVRMQDGFIEKYFALDILKDIESTHSVDADGNLIIHQINIHNMDEDPKNMRSRDPKDILREQGLL